MGQMDIRKLDTGDLFPTIDMTVLGRDHLLLPNDANGRWAVLIIYRGYFCPFSRQQVADFQRYVDQFDRRRIFLIATSTDSKAEAEKMKRESGADYSIGYDLDAREVATLTGAYYDDKKGFLHETAFVLKPNGNIAVASYSTGPIGRMFPQDILRMIDLTFEKREKERRQGRNSASEEADYSGDLEPSRRRGAAKAPLALKERENQERKDGGLE